MRQVNNLVDVKVRLLRVDFPEGQNGFYGLVELSLLGLRLSPLDEFCDLSVGQQP